MAQPEIFPESDPTQILCQRLKQLRKKEAWTLEQLAVASGVSRSMLSQIERGEANPTLAVACRIARAFAISIAELVDEPWSGSNIEVIRANDPAYQYRADSQCRIRTLSPLAREKDIEFYELTLAVDAALESAAHVAGAREFLTVEKGSVEIVSGSDVCKLRRGDSAHYRADLAHSIRNLGKADAVCFLVVTYD